MANQQNQHWMAKESFAPMGEGGDSSLKSWVQVIFLKRAIETNQTFYQNYICGTCTDVEELVKNSPFKNDFCARIDRPTKQSKGTDASYLSDDSFVNIEWDPEEKSISVSVFSLNEQKHQERVDFLDEHIQATASAGRIYMLKETDSGFHLQSIGVAGLPLEKGNYAEEVVTDFNHIVSEYQKKDPCGRLVVLEGDPGTGKTYLIRALIDACPDSLFVMIPPVLVERLANPDFVPALIAMRSNDETRGPTILIFEDADSVLAERQAQNMGGINACLNLSDGIIGSVLDIRIVASTNSKKVEIDEAILRDGRLCRYISVGPLGNTQAHQVYERLTGTKIERGSKDDPLTDKEHTLAEIYKKARKNSKVADNGIGYAGRRPRQRRAGFQTPS